MQCNHIFPVWQWPNEARRSGLPEAVLLHPHIDGQDAQPYRILLHE